ncbi:MAG: cyclic nucleotide-binding domain-containing protein [Thermoleophilia bacterium]|nr:cyclic nucleotide-binding domain-containing protein [Thermoleophilia bacterium]
MRIESSVVSISWIPSDAVKGMPKLPFELGVAHYDDPPPEQLRPLDLDRLTAEDAFRESNELRAWIEVEDGRIVDAGYAGGGRIGVTRVKLGPRELTIPAVALPTLQAEPELRDGEARFVQSAGGRTGAPAPRRVRGKPYFQLASSIAWTTLALAIRADGSSEWELVGASAFPRHWIYDDEGNLVAKSGVIDFETWYRESYERNTPWGDEESEAVLAEVESSLERELSRQIMGAKPRPRKVEAGETLIEQGTRDTGIYLVLDGMFDVSVDGEVVGEVGPGSLVGERAGIELGTRTATVTAATRARVVEVDADELDPADLYEVSAGHRREPGGSAS